MKLNSNLNMVERSGLSENQANKFTIEASAKAFEILSSNIYSDPKLAVVRELMCNAYDAHVDAGNQQTPFKVTLPDEMSPFFEVYDYGPGMTHDQIMFLYTRFFGSTKDQSNDFIGAMGIGSKSPFAYTTQFVVESRQKGELRSYSVYITEDGSPEIILVETRTTDEPNGLTVRVPVKKQDFNEFKSRIIMVSRGFSPTPEGVNLENISTFYTIETTNGSKVYIPEKRVMVSGTYVSTGSTATRLQHSGSYNSKEITAVVKQGSVYYPMSLPEVFKSERLKNFGLVRLGLLAHSTLIIEVPIGSCQIAASRETLRYDKSTVAFLEQVLIDVASSILTTFNPLFIGHNDKRPAQLHAELTELMKPWTWVSNLYESGSHFTEALSEHFNVSKKTIAAWWVGEICIDGKQVVNWTKAPFCDSSAKFHRPGQPETLVSQYRKPEIIFTEERIKSSPKEVWTLSLRDFDAVVFNDTLKNQKPVSATMRIRYSLGSGMFSGIEFDNFKVLCLSPDGPDHPDAGLTKDELIKKFKLQGYENKVYFVSDLQDRPRRRIDRDPVTKLPKTIFRGGVYKMSSSGSLDKVDKFDLQAAAGKLYLPLSDIRNLVVHPDVALPRKPVICFLDIYTLRGLDLVQNLYIINSERYARIKKLPHQMIRVDDWLRSQYRKAWDNNKIPLVDLARWVWAVKDVGVIKEVCPSLIWDPASEEVDLIRKYYKHVSPMPGYKLPSNVQDFFNNAQEIKSSAETAGNTLVKIEEEASGLKSFRSPDKLRTIRFLVNEIFTKEELNELSKSVNQVLIKINRAHRLLQTSKYCFITDGVVRSPQGEEDFTTKWFPSIFNNCKKGTSNV